MTHPLNETHDPRLRSWVESANNGATDFPIQNLPFGVFRPGNSKQSPRIGIAIGDRILDLAACGQRKLLDSLGAELAGACLQPSLNTLMSLGPAQWTVLRRQASRWLRSDTAADIKTLAECLVPMANAEMLLPAVIGNYTDFYASIHHAMNVGRLFRPDAPLPPNYKFVPIAYHGRVSSLVVSGTPVRRPCGQSKDDNVAAPTFSPSRALDYELELGLFIGPGNRLGEPIPIAQAGAQLFGVCLVNDWSARDLQKWEYQPLGPFLGKNFATTVSPWVVTLEALAPFRVPASIRPATDPRPLPYLQEAENERQGGIGITLEAWLQTAQMRASGEGAVRLSQGRYADQYWTPAQLVTHHASNGCNLLPGDLLASGTVSGPAKENCGCLLELTSRGAEPLSLPGGETRRFLEDGDEVTLRGFCELAGRARVGLGECRGIITAAPASSNSVTRANPED
jgi:fumarylacetoacetase